MNSNSESQHNSQLQSGLIGDKSDRPTRYDTDLARKFTEFQQAEAKKKKVTEPTPKNSKENSETVIQSTDDFWSIDGISYRDGIYRVDLAKTLLDKGAKRTQKEWIKYSEVARTQNQFYTPDFPLFYGLVKALYSSRENSAKAQEIAEAQKFIKDNSQSNWLMTLTRIVYYPTANDVVIHNVGLADCYGVQTDFVGLDGEIIKVNTPEAYKALLGTNDSPQEINSIFQGLNGIPTNIWRLNSRPNQVDERVAGFGADSDWAYLSCYWNPTGSDPALGVRAVRKPKTPGQIHKE